MLGKKIRLWITSERKREIESEGGIEREKESEYEWNRNSRREQVKKIQIYKLFPHDLT